MENKINSHLIQANINLQDENHFLKIDKKMLEKRIENAVEYFTVQKRKSNRAGFDIEEKIQKGIDILEGNYFYEEKKKK